MMMKRILINIIIIVIIGLMVGVIFISGYLEELKKINVEECQIPKWSIGDTWVYRDPAETYDKNYPYYMKVEVINQTEESYTTRLFNPNSQGFFDYEVIDRDTFLPIKGCVGKKCYEKHYSFLSGKLWPLEIGKTVIINTTERYRILSWTTETYTETYKVTGKKKINVLAGTFEAYKIEYKIKHNSSSYSKILWYSPRVKNYIRIESPPGSVFMELFSYSLADK